MAGRLADSLCRWLLGTVSVNPEKNAEEVGWEVLKICWGLLYNTVKETVTLPDAKLLIAFHLLHDPAFDPGVRRLPLKLAMQLRGNAEYWVLVLPCLAVELKVMDLMLSAPEGVTTHTGDTQPERIWRDWEETIELCRLYVDDPESWNTRFCVGLDAVLSPVERLASGLAHR